MDAVALTQAVATILGSTGFVLVLQQIHDVVKRVRAGQKLREPARGVQIVQARDDAQKALVAALKRVDRAESLYDQERAKRRAWQDAWHDLRRYCIDHGTAMAAIPPGPPETRPTPTLT